MKGNGCKVGRDQWNDEGQGEAGSYVPSSEGQL